MDQPLEPRRFGVRVDLFAQIAGFVDIVQLEPAGCEGQGFSRANKEAGSTDLFLSWMLSVSDIHIQKRWSPLFFSNPSSSSVTCPFPEPSQVSNSNAVIISSSCCVKSVTAPSAALLSFIFNLNASSLITVSFTSATTLCGDAGVATLWHAQ